MQIKTETLKASKKRSRDIQFQQHNSPSTLVNTVGQAGVLGDRIKYITDMTWWEWVGRKFSTVAEVEKAINDCPAKELAELFEKRKSELSKCLPEPMSIRRVKKWDETDGDTFDNDRFRNGQQAWCRTVRQSVKSTKSITLVCSVSFSACVNAKDIIWNPVTALTITDLLEEAGYTVKLIFAFTSRSAYPNGDDACVSVVMKDVGMPVLGSVDDMNCSFRLALKQMQRHIRALAVPNLPVIRTETKGKVKR